MSFGTRGRSFATVAVLAILAGAAFAACGGDDNGSSNKSPASSTAAGGGIVFDEARADKAAHDVLLTLADLPGSGWSISENDVFEDDISTPPGDACKAVQAAHDRVKATVDAGRTARAQVKINRDGPNGIPAEIEESVSVFRDLKVLDQAWAALLEATGGTIVEDCLRDALKESLAGQRVTVTATKSSPLATVPAGGRAVAADVAVKASGDTVTVHFESYYWKFGNAGITLTVSGSPEDTTAAVAKAAIAAAEKRLKDAAK